MILRGCGSRMALVCAVLYAGCGEPSRLPSGVARDGGVVIDAGSAADGGAANGGGATDGGAIGGTGDRIDFRVTVPAGTPAFDAVHVAGNHADLGAWSGSGLALARQANGTYAGAHRFPRGTALEFKMTRGSWDSVEKDGAGGEITNRAHTVGADAAINVTVARWADRPSVVGLVEHWGDVESQFVATRPVLVYLPPGYAVDAGRRYPVLYFHDGQNLFDRRTAFGGNEWALDETAEALVSSGAIEPIIIVAVGNTPDRLDELTPVYDASVGAGGDADAYARFLIEELKPAIDARYRTQTGAAKTGVGGSSLGGLVSMYLGLTRSTTFGRLGVVSPSVWWGNRDILARVDALPAKLPLRVWVDIGTAEGGGGETVIDARALRDALIAKGWVLDADLSYREVAGATHSEPAWAARAGDILRFLYPPP
jgi:predicted alpha/beta superfamily hydrolase